MDKPIKHIKAGIYIERDVELLMSVNGERLEDYENQFNDLYFDAISNVMNHERWGVWFKQISELDHKFIVDIYVDTNQDYVAIYNVIGSIAPGDIQIEIMSPYWTFDRFVAETIG